MSDEHMRLHLDEFSQPAPLRAKNSVVVKAREGTPKKPSILGDSLALYRQARA